MRNNLIVIAAALLVLSCGDNGFRFGFPSYGSSGSGGTAINITPPGATGVGPTNSSPTSVATPEATLSPVASPNINDPATSITPSGTSITPTGTSITPSGGSITPRTAAAVDRSSVDDEEENESVPVSTERNRIRRIQSSRSSGEMQREENSEKMIEELLDLVNTFRKKNKVKPLRVNKKLSVAAQDFAAKMSSEGFFDQTSSDGSSPQQRQQSVGISTHVWGENLAGGHVSPEEVFEDWLGSPSHRANLLSQDFTETGIGYSIGVSNEFGNHYPVWVQELSGSQNSGSGSDLDPR